MKDGLLPSWNDTGTRREIVGFAEPVTRENSPDCAPLEERLAAMAERETELRGRRLRRSCHVADVGCKDTAVRNTKPPSMLPALSEQSSVSRIRHGSAR